MQDRNHILRKVYCQQLINTTRLMVTDSLLVTVIPTEQLFLLWARSGRLRLLAERNASPLDCGRAWQPSQCSHLPLEITRTTCLESFLVHSGLVLSASFFTPYGSQETAPSVAVPVSNWPPVMYLEGRLHPSPKEKRLSCICELLAKGLNSNLVVPPQ